MFRLALAAKKSNEKSAFALGVENDREHRSVQNATGPGKILP
jgi:hypothetical protein